MRILHFYFGSSNIYYLPYHEEELNDKYFLWFLIQSSEVYPYWSKILNLMLNKNVQGQDCIYQNRFLWNFWNFPLTINYCSGRKGHDNYSKLFQWSSHIIGKNVFSLFSKYPYIHMDQLLLSSAMKMYWNHSHKNKM